VKEKMMYKEFNKLIKKTKTAVYSISTLNSLIMRYKIIIYLSEKYIIKNEK